MNTEEIKKDIAARIDNLESQLENNRNILSQLSFDSVEFEIIYRHHLECKQTKKDLTALLGKLQ